MSSPRDVIFGCCNMLERTATPKGPSLCRAYHGGPAAKFNEMFACLEDGGQHDSSSLVSKNRSGIELKSQGVGKHRGQ